MMRREEEENPFINLHHQTKRDYPSLLETTHKTVIIIINRLEANMGQRGSLIQDQLKVPDHFS